MDRLARRLRTDPLPLLLILNPFVWDFQRSLNKLEVMTKISSMRLVSVSLRKLHICAKHIAGTLTIGRHGESSFLGKTARSEVCFPCFTLTISLILSLYFLVSTPCMYTSDMLDDIIK